MKFARLTVLADTGKRYKGKRIMACACDCGREVEVVAAHLSNGNTRSCGCYKREVNRVNGRRNGKPIAPRTVFGRLTVLRELDERHGGQLAYECLCECGDTTRATGTALRTGDTRSCGCLLAESRLTNRRVHGMAKRHPLYYTWCNMRGRCNSPSHPRYKDWGGRGIRICDRWNDFATFVADMGERPPGKTLDRIDNDGDYEPSNCRWATPMEQRYNRRDLKRPLP